MRGVCACAVVTSSHVVRLRASWCVCVCACLCGVWCVCGVCVLALPSSAFSLGSGNIHKNLFEKLATWHEVTSAQKTSQSQYSTLSAPRRHKKLSITTFNVEIRNIKLHHHQPGFEPRSAQWKRVVLTTTP